MKKQLLIFVFFLSLSSLSAQVPQAIKYQAVARDSAGEILSDQNIKIKISILGDSINSIAEYSETHDVITNSFGLVNIEIGRGNIINGDFSGLEWGRKEYFIKTEIDVNGGNNFVYMGISEMVTVPYSFYSQEAGNVNYSDTSATNEIQVLSQDQGEAFLSKGGGSVMTGIPTYDQATIDTLTAYDGFTVHNSTTNCINYHFAGAWYEVCGNCTPLPTTAYAGNDIIMVSGDTVAILDANTPVNGTGAWYIQNGAGGYFDNPADPKTNFHGMLEIPYTLRWEITTPCGSSFDDVVVSFYSWTCDTTFTDARDGQVYTTVKIGLQCWMAQSMNIGTFIQSTQSGTPHSDASDNGIIEKYCYANIPTNCDIYGGLYDWDEMMDYSTVPGSKGICPSGWRLPTDDDWKTLEGNIDSQYPVGSPEWDNIFWRGLDAGENLKDTGDTYWYSPNIFSTNSSGFTALPAGYRTGYGDFWNISYLNNIWTSTEASQDNVWHRVLSYDNRRVNRNTSTKAHGLSVRCLRECLFFPTQAYAGPDQLNVIETNIFMNANTAVDGVGEWSIFSGTGGVINDINDPNTLFHGMPDQYYVMVWTISTLCSASSDTVIISFSPNAFSCGDTLIDSRDNKEYLTVEIGAQCWMAENLNIGTKIASTQNQTNNGIIEKYCYFDSDGNCDTYGGLYQWNEMMQYTLYPGASGICPNGWHLPSDVEWCTLESYVDTSTFICYQTGWRGANVGGSLKAVGTLYWNSPNIGATDEYGFNALPAGLRKIGGLFDEEGNSAYFWSSYSGSTCCSWRRILSKDNSQMYRNNYDKDEGYSVRCVRDK